MAGLAGGIWEDCFLKRFDSLVTWLETWLAVVRMERWRGWISKGVFWMMVSIWDGVVFSLSLARSCWMYSLLIGHLSEADVWPSPWEEHLGVQEFWCEVCWVDKQVGQTLILVQAGSCMR